MSKRKKQKKKIKIYSLLVIILVLAIAVVMWYTKTAPQPEVFPPETESQTEKTAAVPLEKETDEVIDKRYLTATFSDSFSSLAWLDTKQTTLYFDWTGTNLLFPPDIAVEEMTASPLLDTFVPELVQQKNNTVMFYGHHLLNNQKAVMIWNNNTNTWTKKGFDTLGISPDHVIISIYAASKIDQWIVFTKAEQTSAFHVYTFNSDMTAIDSADLGTIPQDVSLACGMTTCLIYYRDSSEFFTLDMVSLGLTRVRDLQNVVRQKQFDSIVIQYTTPVIHEVRNDKKEMNNTERWVIGLTREKAFEIWQYAPFTINRSSVSLIFSQTLEYPGHLALLPRVDGRIFILWASYFTRAYEIINKTPGVEEESNDGKTPGVRVTDLSARFGWRISNNSPVHLYELDHTIYISNGDGTLIRFDGEINTRIDNIFWFNFTPGFLKIIPYPPLSLRGAPPSGVRGSDEAILSSETSGDMGYVIAGVPGGGTKIYTFTDSGVDLGAVRQVVSKQVNFEVYKVNAAQISGLELGGGRAKIEYFLSNDGGKTWKTTDVGTVTQFENFGKDLRWKIKISPYKNADPYKTPYLRSIGLTYWYAR